jgi:membrane protease YdiL (CAAX protease family)
MPDEQPELPPPASPENPQNQELPAATSSDGEPLRVSQLATPEIPEAVRLVPGRAGIHSMFLGEHGLRAGWRALLFLLFAALFTFVFFGIESLVIGHLVVPATMKVLFGEMPQAAGALAATVVMARIDGRRLAAYGWPAGRAGSLFAAGLFWGFMMLTVMLLALDAGGSASFAGPSLAGSEIVANAFVYFAGFLMVGVFEESLFRGYLLYTLRDGLAAWLREGRAFWGSAVLLSLMFAAAHRGNPGETPFGLFSVFLFGLVLAFAIRRTGSLWWAVGFHCMWDYSESFIYGTADSGGVLPGHLLSTRLRGPEWVTGGSVGPEGSYFIVMVLAALALLIHLQYPAQRPAAIERRGHGLSDSDRVAI